MTFSFDIINIVKKAMQKQDEMGVESVSVTEALFPAETLQISWHSPTRVYCCQLWNPWKAKEIQAIEAIQRTFRYKITQVYTLSRDAVNVILYIF